MFEGGLFPKDREILASFIFLLKRDVEGHKEQNLSEYFLTTMKQEQVKQQILFSNSLIIH